MYCYSRILVDRKNFGSLEHSIEKINCNKLVNCSFNLNDSKYRTKEFVAFIEDVIEYKFIPKKNRYCNLVVELFIEKLEKMPFEKALKLCEIVYGQLVINGKI